MLTPPCRPWVCEHCGFRVNNNGSDSRPVAVCCDERRVAEAIVMMDEELEWLLRNGG